MNRTKKNLSTCLVLLAVAMMMVSCIFDRNVFDDHSPVVTQKRGLKDFEKIEISGWPTVYYTQGADFSVEVEGPEKSVGEIVTEVKGKTLYVSNKGKIGILNISVADSRKLVVRVTSPDLTGIQLNGSGNFNSQQRVDTDNLSIGLQGSGDITFEDVICDHCTTSLVGSGDIEVKHLESQTSVVSLIGSGDVEIKQWHVDRTIVTLTGSGDVDIDFVEGCRYADCRLTGSGDVSLKGIIEQFKRQKSGSGDIDTDKLSIQK